MRYKCLVLDHDDTVVQTEKTIGYPYFRDYIERIRPGQTLSYPEYVKDCNNMVFADMCRERWQMTEEELTEEYLGWKAYSRVNVPDVCEGVGEVIRRQKEAGGIVCVSSLSTREIIEAVMALFDRIVDPELLVRRVNIVACHVLRETDVVSSGVEEQLNFFAVREDSAEKEAERRREKCRQQAVIGIRKKFGKNAILKGMNLQEGATARDRNAQIGGHKA